MGRGGDAKESIPVCFCFALVFGMCMLINGFVNVSEGQCCLYLNTYTRMVSEEPVCQPTRSFLGPYGDYICFDTKIQNLEFSGDNALNCRTVEGLKLQLDINIEFRLSNGGVHAFFVQHHDHDEGHTLANMFGRVAWSNLRNACSRFGATDYLKGSREAIQAAMNNDLEPLYDEQHGQLVNLNLRHIAITENFETAFRGVEQVYLETKQQTQQREVDLMKESRNMESLRLQIKSDRTKTLLDELSKLAKAKLNRDGQITAKQTAIATARLKGVTARQTVLIDSRAQVSKAEAERNAAVALKGNERMQKSIQLNIQLDKAVADAAVYRLQANATASASLKESAAEAEGFAYLQESQLTFFSNLKSSVNMNNSDIMRYQWLQTLKKFDNAPVYVDYKKVPFYSDQSAAAFGNDNL